MNPSGLSQKSHLGIIRILRLIWVLLAASILWLSANTFPVVLEEAVTPCRSAACATFELNSINQPALEEVRLLIGMGISLHAYALYQISFLMLGCLFSFCLSVILIHQRKPERLAVLMSFAFLLWSNLFPNSVYQILPDGIHIWYRLLVDGPHQVIWMLMFFLFPDGRLAPRWVAPIPVTWAAVIELGVIFPASPFNQFNWPAWLQSATLTIFLIAIYAQAYKYRRYGHRRRQQTKWVIFGMAATLLGGISLALVLFTPTFTQPGLPRLVGYPSFALVVIGLYLCFAIAILRDRLWDIDILIRRTLVYGTLTVILVSVYVGSVIHLQQLFRLVSGAESPLAIVVSTLAIAVLAHPARRRVQDLIDRRFYRRKYDTAKTLAALNSTLREEVDLNRLSDILVGLAEETLQPEHISLWIYRPEGTQDPSPGR